MTKQLAKRHAEREQFQASILWTDAAALVPMEYYARSRTYDLSLGGFSFLSDSRVDCDNIFVIFLLEERPVEMKRAKVIHCQEGFWERRRQFRVGCAFEHATKSRLAWS